MWRRSSTVTATSRASPGRSIRPAASIGFFRITGHGVDPDLLGRIDAAARQFFAQPDDVEAVDRDAERGAGVARLVPGRWRTDVGTARPQGGSVLRRRARADAPAGRRRRAAARAEPVPRRAGRPRPGGPRLVDATRPRGGGGDARHRDRARARRRPGSSEHLTADPTVLFRIFHYPPGDDSDCGASPSTPTTACSRCSPRTTAAACRSTPRTAGSTCPPSPTCSCATSATCSTG